MRAFFLLTTFLVPAVADAQGLQAGSWDVTSTVVSMAVPGWPSFIERMVRGKSKAERKSLPANAGIEALLAPDPKAHCQIDVQHIAAGRYDQQLTCPQKRGGPLRIVRSGTFSVSGSSGRATVDGVTSKGPLRIVLDQRATRMKD